MGLLNKLGNLLFKGLIGASGAKSHNPYIQLLLQADEQDLIADELFRLSLAYQEGQYGLKRDQQKAMEFCEKAAGKGHTLAQLFLAQWLMQRPDDANKEVLKWLEEAAKQGERQACYNFGISIHRGDLPNLDAIVDSLPYFRKSAELGYQPAYQRMAFIYLNGEGIEKNTAIAKYWAMLDYANETNALARSQSLFLHLIDAEDVVDEDKTMSEVIEGSTFFGKPSENHNYKKINHKKIIQEAAEAGERDAMCNMGTGLLSEDKDRAKDILQRAVTLGHPIAACNLGRQLWTPEMKKYCQVRDLFMIGAEQGIAESQYGLAVIYGDGLGVDKNMETCWLWLEKSLNQGCHEARRYFANKVLENQFQNILRDTVMRGPAYAELAAQ